VIRWAAIGIVVLAVGAPVAYGKARRDEPECRVIKVVDSRGRPIVGAEITLFPCGSEAMHCDGNVWETDRRGRVCAEELLHATGSLDVIAPSRLGGQCADAKHWLYPKDVPGGNGTGPIVITMNVGPLARASLKGRVTTADGRPIKGATIDVQKAAVDERCEFDVQMKEVRSSADGRFSFAAVPKGTATLRVKHADFAPRLAEATVPGSGATVVLDNGASWEGRVLDPDGAPVSHCRVVTEFDFQYMWYAVAPCAAGRFTLRHLPAAELKINVATEEESQLGRRGMSMRTHITAGEHRVEDLTWPKGVTLSGVIVDAGGAPIAAARLSAEQRSGQDEVVVRADGDGRFAFRHLSPGKWVLRGDYRTGRHGRLEVDATEDRDGLRLEVPTR
jgi:protocatechuate 3,4-dioxygenase beta subunit